MKFHNREDKLKNFDKAVNDEEKIIDIFEVKINPKKTSLVKLKEKAKKLVPKYPKYRVIYAGYSLEDIEN